MLASLASPMLLLLVTGLAIWSTSSAIAFALDRNVPRELDGYD